jgi:predicted ribosome quality control (RQC) complex YloA/Tae2 family protein
LKSKEFTSFDVAIIVQEIEEAVTNSRVNNIYQFGTKTILLKLHKANQPPLRLVMEAGRRMHLTAYALRSPRVPPAFCMALRKHLRGAWLEDLEQYEFERIVVMKFKTKTGLLRLILELFGEGNIILVAENGAILQALFFKRMRDRNIIRNEPFQFPPSRGENPFKVTREELKKTLKNCDKVEVVRVLTRFLGIGGFYAEEILIRAEIEKSKNCGALSTIEVDAIFNVLQSLLQNVTRFEIKPSIVLAEDGGFLDVVPFKLRHYETKEFKTYRSFNDALDEFYLKATATERATSSVEMDKITKETERLRRIVTEQEKAMQEHESEAEHAKRIGDTIYTHANGFQELLNRFATAKSEGRDWNTLFSEVMAAQNSDAKPEKFVESFDRRNLLANISVDNLHFSLNLRRTLYENASEYYERGKKAKEKLAGAKAALEISLRKLKAAEQKKFETEAMQEVKPLEIMEELAKRKVKRKEWYEKFRWFKSSEDFLVVAGKDAVSNEVLIKKHAAPEDLAFHADITGAPFVVVKTDGKTPSSETIQETSAFAAAFSRAWREGLGSVDVYWVKPEQLSKSGPSGEYVARGAFAVFGKRNWMRGVTLQLAIGVIKNQKLRFLGGPVEAVKKATSAHVTLVPGDTAGKKFLSQILQALSSKLPKDQSEIIRKTSIEQIREFVPFTRGRLAKSA